jgi:hypothetical protein
MECCLPTAITQCSPLSLQRGAVLRRPSRPLPTRRPEGLQIKCDGRVGCHTGVPPATRRAAASTADSVSDGKREAQSTAAATATTAALAASRSAGVARASEAGRDAQEE